MRRMLRHALVFLLLAAAGLAGFVAWDVWGFLQRPLAVSERQLFQVAPGSSLTAVSRRLAEQGLIRQPHQAWYLSWYGRLQGRQGQLKAGEYEVRPGMTAIALLDDMVSGRAYLYSLTLIEGWTFRQMMAAVNAHPALKHSLAGSDAGSVMQALGHAGEHPEGRFFPDTYHFPAGTRDVDFLRRAYTTMQRILEQEWQGRAEGLPLASPYEALILASIVQRETALARERQEIAGVFVRRLRLGMRLQTDPTVIYGLGEAFDGDIRFADLRNDTPYNTYTRAGLPPTPICMPGRDDLHAALHPAGGNTLYFVAKGDGSHHFSATLEEHNAAVRTYQLKQPAAATP